MTGISGVLCASAIALAIMGGVFTVALCLVIAFIVESYAFYAAGQTRGLG
jgi:hypothetical protein